MPPSAPSHEAAEEEPLVAATTTAALYLFMPTLCPLDPRLRIVNASSPIGSFPMAVLSDARHRLQGDCARRYWELKYPSELLHLAGGSRGVELPRPGTFLDIGANLGFYTLLFAQHGYSVLAVEAMLLNRKAIETSLCLNPLLAARVRLMPVALGTVAAVNGKTRCVVPRRRPQSRQWQALLLRG